MVFFHRIFIIPNPELQMLKKWIYSRNNLILEHKELLTIFLITRILIIGFLSFQHFFYPVSISGASSFISINITEIILSRITFSAYDSQYYLEIANYGYSNINDNPGLKVYAYFPLFPIIIKFFSIFLLGEYFFSWNNNKLIIYPIRLYLFI